MVINKLGDMKLGNYNLLEDDSEYESFLARKHTIMTTSIRLVADRN